MAYSYVQYVGDGSTTLFSVTFPYINAADIAVSVNGTPVSFTMPTASSVAITPAPAVAAVIDIRRDTQKTTRLVDFQDAAILTEASLDQDSNQLMYIAQETLDDAESALKLGTDGTYDVGNARIKNVAAPVSGTDAANKDYVDTGVVAHVNQAQTYANNAATSADSAATSAGLADTAKTAAQAAQAAAELIFDTFDDKYLGSKAADPTLDNDGDPLADGAMYFNTTTNVLKVYDLGTTTWLTIPSQTLAALTDIALASLTNNDMLVYNSGTGKWNNKTPAQILTLINAASNISTQTIFIPGTAFYARTTNGPASGSSETPTNKVMVKGWDFDAAVAEYVQTRITLPKGVDASSTLTARFHWSNLTNTTGNVVWGMQWQIRGDAVAQDSAFGAAVTVTDDTGGSADYYRHSAESSGATSSGSVAGERNAVIQVYRDAANASDTATADVRLLGVVLKYTTTSMNDA